MQLDVIKVRGQYVDKTTKETRNCTHFYLLLPNGRRIQIRTSFKEDLQKLDWLIPLAEQEAKPVADK